MSIGFKRHRSPDVSSSGGQIVKRTRTISSLSDLIASFDSEPLKSFTYSMGHGFTNDLILNGIVIRDDSQIQSLEEICQFIKTSCEPDFHISLWNIQNGACECKRGKPASETPRERLNTKASLIICEPYQIPLIEKKLQGIFTDAEDLIICADKKHSRSPSTVLTFRSILRAKIVVISHEFFSNSKRNGGKICHGFASEQFPKDEMGNLDNTTILKHLDSISEVKLQYFMWNRIIVNGMSPFLSTRRDSTKKPIYHEFCLLSKSKIVIITNDTNEKSGELCGILDFLACGETPPAFSAFVKGKRDMSAFPPLLEENLWKSLQFNTRDYYPYQCKTTGGEEEKIKFESEPISLPITLAEAVLVKLYYTQVIDAIEHPQGFLCNPAAHALKIWNMRLDKDLPSICDDISESALRSKALWEEYQIFVNEHLKPIINILWEAFWTMCGTIRIKILPKSPIAHDHDEDYKRKYDIPGGALTFYSCGVVEIRNINENYCFECSTSDNIKDPSICDDLARLAGTIDGCLSSLLITARDMDPHTGHISDLIGYLESQLSNNYNLDLYRFIDSVCRTMVEVLTRKYAGNYIQKIEREEIRRAYTRNVKDKYQTSLPSGFHSDWEQCPICLNEFQDILVHSITACGHIFCQSCSSQIFKNSKMPASCPVCKYELYFPAEDFIFPQSWWDGPSKSTAFPNIPSKISGLANIILSLEKCENVLIVGSFKYYTTEMRPGEVSYLKTALGPTVLFFSKPKEYYKNISKRNSQTGITRVLCIDKKELQPSVSHMEQCLSSMDRVYFITPSSVACERNMKVMSNCRKKPPLLCYMTKAQTSESTGNHTWASI